MRQIFSTYSTIHMSPLWGYVGSLVHWWIKYIALRWSAGIGHIVLYRHQIANPQGGAKDIVFLCIWFAEGMTVRWMFRLLIRASDSSV